MAISRRTFIGTIAQSAVPLGLGLGFRPGGSRMPTRSVGGASAPGAGTPLRIPRPFTGTAISAETADVAIWPEAMTQAWTLGGSYPAPTIRIRTGDTLDVDFTNRLSEPTNIHWHGLMVPPGMDGHPKDAVMPNDSFDYTFTVSQRAGTYWYHPHPHMRTAPQVYKGMAGFFIVEDDEERALGLPSGEFDIPLLIQDRVVTPTRELLYEPNGTQQLNGYLGDTVLVNGTSDAVLEVAPNLYRFRVLNGSNGRILNIGFEDGTTFFIIGTDGGLLDRPYEVTSALLGIGERLDILVDFSSREIGQSLLMKTLAFGGATTYIQQGWEMPALRFDVTKPAGARRSIPPALATLERLDPSAAALTRIVSLDTNPGRRPHHSINGRVFEMERIDMEVRLGDIEIWEIRNLHIMPHPIHIHGAQFQVLERINGLEMSARDYGWKDTILVWKEETVRIIVRFAPQRGTYLFHCHNLEHEDEGMMINYAIGDRTAGVAGRASDRKAETIDLR